MTAALSWVILSNSSKVTLSPILLSVYHFNSNFIKRIQKPGGGLKILKAV